MNMVGIIFSNIHDNNISELTSVRTMASIPFGGRYRLIDFALSNMVNSGVSSVGIITKSNYQSLINHLGTGKEWDLSRKRGGLTLLPPFGNMDALLYTSRLEALKGTINYLTHCTEEYVIISDSDTIGHVDYAGAMKAHIDNQADITCVYKRMIPDKNLNEVIFDTGDEGRIEGVRVNPEWKRRSVNISLNIWIVKKDNLITLLRNSISMGYKSFSGDILRNNTKKLRIFAYEQKGYFVRISSLQKYFEYSMQLLQPGVREELFNSRNTIYTSTKDSAPTKHYKSSSVKNSIIADGCKIMGSVENSIIFRNVTISADAVVKNSIIMQNTIVSPAANLNFIVADKNTVIREKRVLCGCEVKPYFIHKSFVV